MAESSPETSHKASLENILENIEQQESLSEMFSNRSVFITGVTGFLGKVLLEKLLRSCPEIKHVYVLLRPKPDQDIRRRLDMLLDNTAYDNIRRVNPGALSKVIPFSGDVSRPELGLRECDLKILTNNVSYIFNCAATVRFDEKPRKALSINLLGVKHLLDVCKRFKFQALVHVSTAYSFCNFSRIDEQNHADMELVTPENLILLLQWMNDDTLEDVVKHVLNNRPSIYHFSKAMAEIYLINNAENLPVFIIRPPIITAAWKEPYPGWIDNLNGPSGLIAACGKGIVRSVYANPDVTAHWIPVDFVANIMIIAAYKAAVSSLNETRLVNCISSEDINLTWGDVEKVCYPLILKYPSMDLFRYPGGSFKSNRFMHRLAVVFTHFLPAYVVDTLSSLIRINSDFRMVNVYNRIHRVMSHLEFFTTTQFDFRSYNYEYLILTLPEAERKLFPFDMRLITWEEYMEAYVLGVRRYLLKERDSTLTDARKKLNRIYYVWLGIHMATISSLLWFLHCCRPNYSRLIFTIVKESFSQMLDFFSSLSQFID